MNTAAREAVPVLLETDGEVARLTLNRPDRMNAMNLELVAAMTDALQAVKASSEAKALLITGAGRGFCSGEDLRIAAQSEADVMMEFIAGLQEATNCLLDLEIPTIAAVNGAAIGGGAELLMACDWKVASSDAVIGFPETSLGVIVTGGGLALLEAHVGRARALELLLGGEQIQPERAKEIGLVTEVAEAEEFPAAVEKVADRLARLPALAVAELKKGLRELDRKTIERSMSIETAAIRRLYSHPDSRSLAGRFKARTRDRE